MMLKVKEIEVSGYEKVIEAIDTEVGLHSFIAVHNTKLGPSMGGTRIYPYISREAALEDALRLSKGMTYKSAMAEIGLGGGKSVIIADPKTQKSPELFAAFAKAVDTLKGKYICAEDVGSTPADMATINKWTPFVAAMDTLKSSGDPSPFTAWGCFRGIQAAAKALWGSPCLQNKTIAVQGLGAVGFKLAEFLFWHGAQLLVTDIDENRTNEAIKHYGATVLDTANFCTTKCDILAPCALGPVINDDTIDHLNCKAIAGSANNQLQHPDLGQILHNKGILYAPDFVINAGGIINASVEFDSEGYSPKASLEKINRIYDCLLAIFDVAEERKLCPSIIADEIAESKIACGVGKRGQTLAL